MVDIAKLLKPKIIISVSSILVLLVIGMLIVIFCIRNQKVTGNLYVDEANTTSREIEHRTKVLPSLVTKQTTVLTSTRRISPFTVPATATVTPARVDKSASTVHAIEPVKRD